jgi:hypothetical protein
MSLNETISRIVLPRELRKQMFGLAVIHNE